ncbi:HK97-gp10 family putative phage morphogenesis protein [Methylophaga sp. OBS4]|uniref:HK97-gp10 family putative phage morphogenesis protein n=1 Tax=Methylophaga sp. OBS4 TaxID=2991935 RepID=UPI002254EEBA|nr:HK97-gp10 family putative phage morphogenesis protein [Methylophaga sp. OBS4]MCX4186771.1 HK97 gp10 family phage protein [Methylophaga sp. OBS4]
MDVQFELLGAEQINAKLKAVTEDIRYKSGRAALRKAANIIRDAAISNAQKIDDPMTADNIAANIATRWDGKRFKQTGNLGFRIGVRGGARAYGDTRENRRKRRVGEMYSTGGSSNNPGGDTWHWRLVEFGTSRSRAQPFMRPALSRNVGAAQAEFIKQYGKGLDRAIKRAAKAGK